DGDELSVCLLPPPKKLKFPRVRRQERTRQRYLRLRTTLLYLRAFAHGMPKPSPISSTGIMGHLFGSQCSLCPAGQLLRKSFKKHGSACSMDWTVSKPAHR